MLFHVDMNHLAEQTKCDVEKKALFWDENRNQIQSRTEFLQFYVKTKKVCRCFANFSSEHFTHGMYSPYPCFRRKKSKRSCSMKEWWQSDLKYMKMFNMHTFLSDNNKTILKHQSRLQQTTNFATSFLIFEKNKVWRFSWNTMPCLLSLN